jgi:hypothetical protein
MTIRAILVSIALLAAACGQPSWMVQQQQAPRAVRVNKAILGQAELETLAQVEASYNTRLPDGDYWYDAKSGAFGRWGGPAEAVIPPGLQIGGPLSPDASGGGTGIYINGRELHPMDRDRLQVLLGGVVAAGRYWVDGQGNAGQEGGPAVVNLYAAARARFGSGNHAQGWNATVGSTGSDRMLMSSDGQTTCVSTADYSNCVGP